MDTRPKGSPNRVTRITLLEDRFHAFLARYCIETTRVAVGVVFFWFGVLKFFPGMSPAQGLAGRTILHLSGGHVPPAFSVPILAMWECCIGLGLLTGLFKRLTLLLLALQLPGTFMPLFFFRRETFVHFPYAPTLEGQYIVKNLVLVSAGLLLGATMHGGRIVVDPLAAKEAERRQEAFRRFRRRFRRQPVEAS